MKIAMIGAGRMGQALTPLFAQAGHEVRLSNSRGPESLADLVETLGPGVRAMTVPEAVEGADVVFLATPWGRTADAVSAVADWAGRVVIDATNNRSGPGPQGLIDIGDRVSSEIVAGYIPGAKVVKAFNVTAVPILVPALASPAGDNKAVYIAGDDDHAKSLVADLIGSIGGVAVDTGGLHTGGHLQGMSGPLAGPLEMLTPTEARSRLAQAQS
jgi:predicted dinucleotide-binding enzyme